MAALMIFSLCGCGGPKPADEAQVQADVEGYEDYAWMEAETTDFEVVRRQTDEDDKTDVAWTTIHGKTDTYTVTRSYEVRYTLYNEGWELDQIIPWYNEDAPDAMMPVSAPKEEDVRAYVESLDLGEYGSYAYVECSGLSDERTPVQGEVTDLSHPQEAVINEQDAYDTWYCTVSYHYDLLDETVEIPIHYYFDFYDGAWYPSVGESSEFTGSATLNDALVGIWGYGDQVTFTVMGIDPDGTGCDAGWHFTYYDGRETSDEGHLALRRLTNKDGEHYYRLRWDDGGEHLNEYDFDSYNVAPMTFDPNTPMVDLRSLDDVQCIYTSFLSGQSLIKEG